MLIDDQNLPQQLVNHKSSLPADNTVEIDVNDLLTADPIVEDEHWLWGSVRRVRRGIHSLLQYKSEVAKPHQRKRLRRQYDNNDDIETSGDDEFDPNNIYKDGRFIGQV